jgi:hypothetical protein
MHFQTSTNVKNHVNKDFRIKDINKVYSTNFLGVILDSTFSWGPHINNLASKLNSDVFSFYFPQKPWEWFTSLIFIHYCHMA